jgi:predicted RNA-binding protein
MTDYISEQQRLEIPKIEIDNLLRLIKKMARKGINSNEIIRSAKYFAGIIGVKREVRFLRMRIFLIRLFNSPKYIFI